MAISLMLTGRTVVVTGGGSGIGREIASMMADHGAKVVVGDFDPPPGTPEEFERRGIKLLACDVRRESDVAELIQAAAKGTGRLDILINNAGVGLVKQIPDVTEAEWDKVLDTNLKGAFLAAKHAIPYLKAGGGGCIVNISSNAGLLPRAHDPVYSTSKGALISLTKCLALSHAKDRIRVNAVCPGPVCDTRMMDRDLDAAADRTALSNQLIAASPLAQAYGRMITPREVAEAVLYLVSDAAQMVTGTSLAIDGGKSQGVPPQ